jgi:hypothetical protein
MFIHLFLIQGLVIAGTMVFILLSVTFLFIILGYILSRKKTARPSLPVAVPWIDEMQVLSTQDSEFHNEI